MAQRTQIIYTDDLDGSKAEGTIFFGLDGAQYEIDLNTSNAHEFRTALARYIDAGRTVTSTTRQARQKRPKTSAIGTSNNEVRAWAKAHGIEVKDRGRIPASVITDYQAANGR